MRPADFDDLILMLVEGKAEPNGTDMIVLLRASELAKGETESDSSGSPMIAEIAALADQAFSDDPAEIEPAREVLFALRQSEASDAADDREEGIRQSEAILRHVDAARFPVTAAGAHLKLGGALPKLSWSDDGVDRSVLRRAAGHLESALALLPDEEADLRAMARYNAALAFRDLWQSGDEWDDDDGDRGKVLEHGLAALAAMDRGEFSGDRSAMSRAVLAVLMADGEPRDPEARDQTIAVMQTWLASREGKSLPRTERRALKEARDHLITGRDRG
ncbi:hypothetical protein QFZ24_009984 [Streptomyces phaeochromogenes]|jgi:hypothetical protein|uniref:hypothetical protein n=1 Tax=Streptomyces phaeochromogenes TaxID=1923 RepID=UPI0027926127|nr:hypothetical protein [Streptomyces phaeochromogenes]MDQ0955975.1 hypothetical protein [Streptomyces phaeochromogenes]